MITIKVVDALKEGRATRTSPTMARQSNTEDET
jgi:hypothetical protein